MDRQDRRLGVVRAREHDLELVLVELPSQARDAVCDLGVEGSIVRLGRELQQHAEILCLAGQLREARHRAREIGTLADQLLGATIVLPEARRAHLHVQRGEPLLFGRDVKDAPEARRYAGRARQLRASTHSASSARAPKAAYGQRPGGHDEAQIRHPVTEARVQRGALA